MRIRIAAFAHTSAGVLGREPLRNGADIYKGSKPDGGCKGQGKDFGKGKSDCSQAVPCGCCIRKVGAALGSTRHWVSRVPSLHCHDQFTLEICGEGCRNVLGAGAPSSDDKPVGRKERRREEGHSSAGNLDRRLKGCGGANRVRRWFRRLRDAVACLLEETLCHLGCPAKIRASRAQNRDCVRGEVRLFLNYWSAHQDPLIQIMGSWQGSAGVKSTRAPSQGGGRDKALAHGGLSVSGSRLINGVAHFRTDYKQEADVLVQGISDGSRCRVPRHRGRSLQQVLWRGKHSNWVQWGARSGLWEWEVVRQL